jgi:hypothetical protein
MGLSTAQAAPPSAADKGDLRTRSPGLFRR